MTWRTRAKKMLDAAADLAHKIGNSLGSSETSAIAPTPTFEMHSLRPEYSDADHGLYVTYLHDELNKPTRPEADKGEPGTPLITRPRNIALTGSYGSGKSSILSKVVEDYENLVVSVSLSTLGSEEVIKAATPEGKDPLETPAITNSIQKEIVKQLLYREEPWNVPGSRYKRIERFRPGRAILLAAATAVTITVVVLLTGALSRVETFFEGAFWPVAASYAGLFLLVGGLTWGAQRIFHNRLRIEKVTSGPASVSLTDKSESFFDKYLDELVYFFEVNKYDIVIFEDLDRFNDPYIFETLRELNTLLNNSKQITPRVITFVYAVKDSIFEQLGRLSINGVKLSKQEVQRLAVTNRTKFFDLVIPVVPFISHQNARDLLSQEMRMSGFTLEKMLVDLVAKYLVDMRLIKNVHNEYGVFAQKILGPKRIERLDPQRLFAMVVYKNLSMTDFEKVKDNDSPLDRIHNDYRALINQQVAAADRRIGAAQARLRKLNSLGRRAQNLGDKLEEYVTRRVQQSGSAMDQSSLELSGAVTVQEFRTTSFWSRWINDPSLMLTANVSVPVYIPGYGSRNASLPIKVALDDLRDTFGDPLNLGEWEAADAEAAREAISQDTDERSFLRQASIKEVLSRTDLTVETEDGTFSLLASAEKHLGKGVALDLLKAGYIDRYFSLYVSLYYDETVTVKARNFIIHAVEPNVMDVNAEIGSDEEIEAMLDDAGLNVFTGRSVYNVQVFDYLLGRDDSRLQASIRGLARDGDDERAFLAAYIGSGTELEKLVIRLAPEWSGILIRLLEEPLFEDAHRIHLLDVALASASSKMRYTTSPELARFIETHHEDLASLRGQMPAASLDAIDAILKSSGVLIDQLGLLSDELRPLVVASSSYRLTKANLESALGGETNLSMDSIRSRDADVYAHVIANIDDYVPIVIESDSTEYTIDSHENFIDILNDIADSDTAIIETIIARAGSARVVKLDALKEELWPLVAAASRLKGTAENLRVYIERREEIDEELAVSLGDTSAIESLEAVEQSDRRELATAILKTTHLSVEKRVQLVTSLGLTSPLAVSDLELGASPELAGQLLTVDLLEDSATVFASLEAAGWPVQRSYIRASGGFEGYLTTVPFTSAGLQALVQDDGVADSVKSAVLTNMATFDAVLTKAAFTALAAFAKEGNITVGTSRLMRFAQAQVNAPTLVTLIDRESDDMTLDDLLALLGAMPSAYRRLTTLRGATTLPLTPANLRIADRLVSAQVVSTRDPNPSGSTFKVNLRQKRAT